MTINDFIRRCNEQGITFSEDAIRQLVTYEMDGMNAWEAFRALISRR